MPLHAAQNLVGKPKFNQMNFTLLLYWIIINSSCELLMPLWNWSLTWVVCNSLATGKGFIGSSVMLVHVCIKIYIVKQYYETDMNSRFLLVHFFSFSSHTLIFNNFKAKGTWHNLWTCGLQLVVLQWMWSTCFTIVSLVAFFFLPLV